LDQATIVVKAIINTYPAQLITYLSVLSINIEITGHDFRLMNKTVCIHGMLLASYCFDQFINETFEKRTFLPDFGVRLKI